MVEWMDDGWMDVGCVCLHTRVCVCVHHCLGSDVLARLKHSPSTLSPLSPPPSPLSLSTSTPHLPPESEVTTVNRCLDAAKACNIDETCQKLRTEYVSACIQPSGRVGPCNRPKCSKALRKFFDRVPPDYTHELLFCPCADTACAERRRQTIVPSCSYEDKEKPNCLVQLRLCKADYVCRSVHHAAAPGGWRSSGGAPGWMNDGRVERRGAPGARP